MKFFRNSFRWLLVVAGMVATHNLCAKVRLPSLISNHMVLQQQSKVALWGWADPGERVAVKASWLSKSINVVANSSGKWITELKTIKAGGPYTISFAAGNTIMVNDVFLGEVWLASGQSNMEFPVGKDKGWKTGVVNYEQEIAAANFQNIRMIDVENTAADVVQSDFVGEWKVCNPQNVGEFSGVGYFFAREIFQATGFPVGIINSTWGGTPAESWTKRDVLLADPKLKSIVENYEQSIEGYPEVLAAYKRMQAERRNDTSKIKLPALKEPIGPKSNKSPYKLYNGMIAPLVPFRLKGVIWYQGESNADRALQYRHLFPVMINSWRSDWKDKKLPFYFVQISPHKGQNPYIREAQLMSFQSVGNTGMVVTTDNGDSVDIHPRNKEIVGRRLSLWALHNEYGMKKITVSGPIYKSMKVEAGKIRLSFAYAEGLMGKDGELRAFTIAGSDQQFVDARAVIKGNQIVVWSDAVANPVSVRFAWGNVPHANLFNNAGLPASPFRTDDWPTTEVK